MADIKTSIENAVAYLGEHPDEARYTDSEAVARLAEGLRFDVEGPGGERLASDMPPSVGGGGAAPSPGWLFRAALASCLGTLIAIEAARDGVPLSSLEVAVDGESDDRGILGMDASVPSGPLSLRARVRATADGGADVREIVERAVRRCPVADAVRREIELRVLME